MPRCLIQDTFKFCNKTVLLNRHSSMASIREISANFPCFLEPCYFAYREIIPAPSVYNISRIMDGTLVSYIFNNQSTKLKVFVFEADDLGIRVVDEIYLQMPDGFNRKMHTFALISLNEMIVSPIDRHSFFYNFSSKTTTFIEEYTYVKPYYLNNVCAYLTGERFMICGLHGKTESVPDNVIGQRLIPVTNVGLGAFYGPGVFVLISKDLEYIDLSHLIDSNFEMLDINDKRIQLLLLEVSQSCLVFIIVSSKKQEYVCFHDGLLCRRWTVSSTFFSIVFVLPDGFSENAWNSLMNENFKYVENTCFVQRKKNFWYKSELAAKKDIIFSFRYTVKIIGDCLRMKTETGCIVINLFRNTIDVLSGSNSETNECYVHHDWFNRRYARFRLKVRQPDKEDMINAIYKADLNEFININGWNVVKCELKCNLATEMPMYVGCLRGRDVVLYSNGSLFLDEEKVSGDVLVGSIVYQTDNNHFVILKGRYNDVVYVLFWNHMTGNFVFKEFSFKWGEFAACYTSNRYAFLDEDKVFVVHLMHDDSCLISTIVIESINEEVEKKGRFAFLCDGCVLLANNYAYMVSSDEIHKLDLLLPAARFYVSHGNILKSIFSISSKGIKYRDATFDVDSETNSVSFVQSDEIFLPIRDMLENFESFCWKFEFE
ncbi:hypothetical protein PCE1_002258 [Barthelona sp. PCE]